MKISDIKRQLGIDDSEDPQKFALNEALERLRELQAAAIEALSEIDVPKITISLSYDRLLAAIDACDEILK